MLDCASRPEAGEALRRRIVLALQDGLPISRYPYRDLAWELNIGEEELIAHIQDMLDEGAIRRIGVVPNHYALGYSHNLMVVWDIDDAQVSRVGAELGGLEFVSHCYRRPRRPGWPYNLFVMVHGRDEDEVNAKIAVLKQRVGEAYRDHTSLKSTRILKKTGLRLRRED